ncbi:MAG: PilZ domain-containing protein [Silicimonas sp.]|nr:PilZ domain-containing protein [Silicimonas sp.]
MEQNFNRRHSPNRRETRVEAMMDIDGDLVPVIIVDISYTGMKISVPEDIAVGTPVSISVLDVTIPAIVHWSRLRFAGVHLLQRMDSNTLRTLEKAHDALADYR